MKNLTRYTFAKDKKTGEITCTNVATSDRVKMQELYPGGPRFFRVTRDDGKRGRVYEKDVVFDPKPEPVPAEPKPKKTKLSMEIAQEIRSAKLSGTKNKVLIDRYKVNKSTITDIMSGRIYNDGSIVYTGKR